MFVFTVAMRCSILCADLRKAVKIQVCFAFISLVAIWIVAFIDVGVGQLPVVIFPLIVSNLSILAKENNCRLSVQRDGEFATALSTEKPMYTTGEIEAT
jgi:hypothetical protein